MLVEKFITAYVRKKNADYLKFMPDADLTVPARTGETATLLYIHIPFCEQLCPYCSFNRVTLREDLARTYHQALRKEIAMYRELGYYFEALYVGGGTPTVVIDELAETLRYIGELFPIREISVETNPNHLTPGNLEVLKQARVNRLSVGVQSFNDDLLKAIERFHKYGSGEEIAGRLRSMKGYFDTINVDMIFNFPTQSMEILERDLAILNDIDADQITYYPLMVSSSTQTIMARKLGVVDYDRGMSYYMKILDTLSASYHPSTAWCFSKNTGMIDEYVVNYEEYAGLGSGSIGYLGGSVYANTFDIEDYIHRIDRGRFPVTAKRDCSLKERLQYDFLMKLFGLRVDMEAMSRRHGVDFAGTLWQEIFFFRLIGALSREGNILSLTRKGQYYWVLMMREFFVAVNNFRDYCRALMDREPAQSPDRRRG